MEIISEPNRGLIQHVKWGLHLAKFLAAMPVVVFHEACHLVAMLIVSPWITKLDMKRCYLKLKISRSEFTVDCQLSYRDGNRWANMFVAVAPLLGWFAGIVLSLRYCPPLYFYFAFYMKYFGMSQGDINTFKLNWYRKNKQG